MDRAALYPSVSGGILFGTLETLLPPNPAAGVDLDFTLAAGYWHRILTGHFQLVTSATVQSRYPAVQITNGTNVLFISRASPGQAASLTWDYSTYRLGQVVSSTTAQSVLLPLPDMWIPPGSHIKTVTIGIDPADQFSLFAFYCERVSVRNMADYYEHWGLDLEAPVTPGVHAG